MTMFRKFFWGHGPLAPHLATLMIGNQFHLILRILNSGNWQGNAEGIKQKRRSKANSKPRVGKVRSYRGICAASSHFLT